MPHASHSVEVAVSPATAWRHLTDVAGFPDWAYGVKRIEFVTKERSGVGAQWKQHEALGPASRVHVMEITCEDPEAEFVIESTTRPHLELRVGVEPTGHGATHMVWALDYEFSTKPAGRAAEPLLGDWLGRTLVRRTAEGFKSFVERREGRRERLKAVPRPGAPEVGGASRARDPEVVRETARLETTGEKLGSLPPVEDGEDEPDEPPVAP